jgi:GT2 family glycosyltransferase
MIDWKVFMKQEEEMETVFPSVSLIIDRPAGLEGNVSFDDGVISGWVKREGSTDPVEINILVDDVLVWEGFARRQIALPGADMVEGKAPQRLPLGFRVLLPDPPGAAPIREQLLRVVVKGGQDIPGSPLWVPYGSHYLGYIEAIYFRGATVVVEGWSIDKRHPSARVSLVFAYAGEFLFTSETTVNRPDLSATGYDVPTGGFHATLPRRDDFNYELLQVFPGRSARSLALTDTANLPHHQHAGGAEAPTPFYGDDEDSIEGTIDAIDRQFVRGWARNATNPHALVLLDLFIDGHIYSTTAANRFRADLAKNFKDHGFHEYRFELSPGVLRRSPGKVQVIPRVGKSAIKHKLDTLPRHLLPNRTIAPRKTDLMLDYRLTAPLPETTDARAALIVVNRNGAALLETMFQSFHAYNSYRNYEFLVVDHGSTDNSAAVVSRWSHDLAVRWLPRDGNFSFSASNNYAAARTDAPILVFVNNDITFTSDILEEFLRYLTIPSVGCVGLKLLDDCPVPRTDGQVAIQHLGVHIDDRNTGLPVLPFETRWSTTMQCAEQIALEVPAVTAAFMACRHDDFDQVGGFSEVYFYGQEDVDLCFKFAAIGMKIVCANQLNALHLRGFTRAKMDQRYARARMRNVEQLESRFGGWIQGNLNRDRFTRPGFWTSQNPRIAFAVTEATQDTLAGDYFTALELAGQLSAQFPCVTAFVEVVAGNQYDLADFDVVIAMRDDFDPRRIRNAPPHLLKICWVRNWFDRFANRESAKLFDLVWASSPLSCAFLEEKLGRRVELVPIATNLWKFQAGKPNPKLQSDYCFTGSYWNLNREIIQMLDPASLPFQFALFGTGWDKIPHLAPFSRGSLPYARMPEVYASTKLVVDDANHVTKAWGAVNSRVFDAIAAGALVVTNGKNGADSLFDSVLPTFDTPQALEDLLWRYLTDDGLRQSKVAELQAIVKSRHTYQLRARTVWRTLTHTSAHQLRIAIKIGAPTEAVKAEWGDYHFAMSMKYEFDKLGHTTRIDCLDSWKNSAAVADHVVIVLRGLSAYQPRSHQINLMWNISHPDKISDHEYLSYDHVFVASKQHTEHLSGLLQDRVSILLQCTDQKFFHPGLLDEGSGSGGVLFVGNSRGTLRNVVRDAIAADLPIEIYGAGWEGLIPDGFVKGTNIANAELGRHYAAASVVLNDHWDNKRHAGFISNRVFDVLACGGRLISDPIPGMDELFGGVVATYETADQLKEGFARLSNGEDDETTARHQLITEQVIRDHTFGTRVRSIMQVVERLCPLKMGPNLEVATSS